MTRWRAALIHLAFSTAIAVVAVFVVFQVWYPAPLHQAVGVTEIFLIVLGVDVTLGPLMTLLVYKPQKRTLKFDLVVIVSLQIVAFGYGMWTVAKGRPVWLVYNVDRFDLVQAYQVDTRKLGLAAAEYHSPSWVGPRWVAAIGPKDAEERNKMLMESLVAGVDLPHHPEYFHSISVAQGSIKQHSKAIDILLRYNSEAAVAQVRQRWPLADAYLPMMAKTRPVSVLINSRTSEVVAIVDLAPWD